MSRTIPIISRQAFEASSSDDAAICFVTITHPLAEAPILLVLDGADYLIDGVTWHRSEFELDLLTDDDRPPSAPFRFPNVDRRAINMLAGVTIAARVDIELVSSAYFDLTADPRVVKPGVTIEKIYRAPALRLTDITADEMMVEGTLLSWDYQQEEWPAAVVTEDLLPGVFAQ